MLAGWGRADPRQLAAARARRWGCAADRASVGIAAALAAGRLPAAADLRQADDTAALVALRRLRAAGSRPAVDLAVSSLLGHDWGRVREETSTWLGHLAEARGASLPPTRREDDRAAALRAWWRGARSTWVPVAAP